MTNELNLPRQATHGHGLSLKVDLSGVEQKIERAKQHIKELTALVELAFDSSGYSFSLDVDRSSGEYIYSVHGVPSLPEETPLILGEIFFNLRSALDHLAWQLVMFDGKTPTDRTSFPLRESPFSKDGRYHATQLVPAIKNQDVLRELERCQPYRKFDVGEPQPLHSSSELEPFNISQLWQLHKLNNIDKHRVLLVVVCAFDAGQMWWGKLSDLPMPKIRVSRRPVVEGDPVVWFDFQGHQPPSEFDPHPSLHASLREPEVPIVSQQDFGAVLDSYRYFVEEWVYLWRFKRIIEGAKPLI